MELEGESAVTRHLASIVRTYIPQREMNSKKDGEENAKIKSSLNKLQTISAADE